MHSNVYKNYVLGLLTVILIFNCVDRLALALLLQDIKTDLHLTDTQLGFVGGIAFALFYSMMGVPIARWADRGNRVTIISVTAALWSAAVALCGAAGSFLQLVLIRIGVAVGEAGCVPPAFSLIADYFTRGERPRATAIYGLGGPLSFTIGFFLAGWLNEFYGWRMTFVLLGVPGLFLAALAWFTLKDPRYKGKAPSRMATAAPTLTSVYITLWRNATFRYLLICLAIMFFFNYGIVLWQPAFFIRSYGLETKEVGMWLTAVYGFGGLAGTYLGGIAASRYAANDESLQLKAMAISIGCSGLLATLVYVSPNHYVAFGLNCLSVAGLLTANGPLFATIQTLVPDQMRATAFSLVYLFANLIGMGLGPLVTGALSDGLRPWAGEESLRIVLLILAPGYLSVAWFAWRAGQTVMSDLTAALVETTEPTS